MYTPLTHSRISVELASPRLLEVRNSLKNYIAMYKRLVRSRIRVKLALPAYLGLGII